MIQDNHSPLHEQREAVASVPKEPVNYKLFMQLFINQLPECKDPALSNDIELMLYRTFSKMPFSESSYELLELINSISSPPKEEKTNGKYYLADRCKTSLIKIVWALNEMKMFKTANGLLPSNKQDVMEEFGRFLHTDLSEYSTLLSRAKSQDKEEGFLEVIRMMEESLRKYYYRG